ncbi:GRIP and coiled-coil domain-containing protein 2 isoform X3 [Athalia rosae]|uniref:GRIP and coiled-coil domain-containing protein 2 isoform X3 n=1 Tax=Athalia rosae TaxID=37344 RepID=UPI0020334E11|nr:GRIP and coiled-coil domain-containing protein 2 isoform X3 [Athalia rosae]
MKIAVDQYSNMLSVGCSLSLISFIFFTINPAGAQTWTKLKIMEEWVKDLGEQNAMLVRTVEELEREAANRVTLLQEKLQQSAATVANITRRSMAGEDGSMTVLANRVSQLKRDEETLQQKIEFLQSDIRGLLELIRRATRENCWSLDGIRFFEIQPSDIPTPLDCTCGQEKEDTAEYVASLKEQVDQLKESEKRAITYQAALEEKLAEQSKQVVLKEETIRKYVSKLQSLRDNLKNHSKLANQIVIESSSPSADLDSDIVTMADIMENALNTNELEIEKLREELRESETKFEKLMHEKSLEMDNLRSQLDQKCMELQQTECRMACLQKESLETRDALTVEVAEKHDLVLTLRKELAMLEEQCRQSDMQTHFKDDIIKEMRRELKHAKSKETCPSSRRVRIKTDTSMEEDDAIDGNAPTHHQGEILVYLSNAKVLMEKEKEALSSLKVELQKMLEDIALKETEACIDDGDKIQMKNLKKRVANSIENISKIYKDKEKSIGLVKAIAKKCKDDYPPPEQPSMVNHEAIQHFRMMEEFRICTVEAQAATEDIREEMATVTCNLNSRHEKFAELTKLVQQIQEHLTKTRENLSHTINQLKIQEQEKLRHSERITNGAMKLKDLKNEMNQMKSDISRCISTSTDNMQECSSIGFVKIHTCDDLLNIVNDEIQQIITNVQIYQTGACNAVPVLLEVKGQLNQLEDCLRNLQKKADEVLIDNEIAQNVYLERSKKLDRLELELDNTHTKMQDLLENFASVMEQVSSGNPCALSDQSDSNYCSQATPNKSKEEDLIKIKDELRKMKKECDDLRIQSLSEMCQAQKQEKINEWKSRVADLQNQIRELQNEAKCETASNEYLRKKIESMEQELCSVEAKAQAQRRCLTSDSAELKSRIFELECTAKRHKENEDLLRRDLDCSEIELKKSKDLLSSYSQYKSDGVNSVYSQDFKYENIPQSFKVLQETMLSARCGLEEIGNELKKLVGEGSSHSILSSDSFTTAMDMLRKYGETTEHCSTEVEKLRNALCSKDKLLENKEEIIKIQKDSIKMTQAELKDLHQKLQEKEQLQERCKDFEDMKGKMEALVKTKNCWEEKYKNMKRLWQEVDDELRELRSILLEKENDIKCCQTEISKCKADMESKECATQALICQLTTKDASIKAMQGMHCVKIKDYEDMLKKSENIERQLRNKIYVLTERDKDMKKQLQKYKMDLDIFEKELQSERKTNADIVQLQNENELLKKELGDHTKETENVINELQILKDNEARLINELEEKQNVKSIVVKDELQKCNCDLVKLTTEAKVKEEELKILKEFKKELEIKDLCGQLKCFEETRMEHSQMIKHLEEQLQMSEDRAEECFGELNVSKEMLAVLRDRICSLKGILQEKSGDMVKLQADHQILKNANSILKAEQGIFENKAREDISDLKKKLKAVQLQLSVMEDNYHRVTQDFNKSQDLLVEATKREVELQRAITSVESNLLSKLSVAEREASRLGDMVDKLSEELEDTHSELSSKNSQLCQAQCRNKCYASQLQSIQQECREHQDTIDNLRITINKLELEHHELVRSKESERADFRSQIDNQTSCNMGDGANKRLSAELAKMQADYRVKACKETAMQCEIQSLKDKLLKAEEVKCGLSSQLQQCLQENCELASKKSILEQNNGKCVSELQDMHQSLLELRQECQTKTKSLVSMSAELSQVAVSRSELCTESQYVVQCIRAWMEKQRNLVETVASKLNLKQQQVMQLAFEKKALLATIRELRRANCALTQRIKRLHKPSLCNRVSKSLYTGCRTSPPLISNLSNSRTGTLSSSYSRIGKKSSLGPIRNARRTAVCGHSWWFPKMEHLTKELRKNNQWWNKNAVERAGSDPGLDESRDCGYQSSTSK